MSEMTLTDDEAKLLNEYRSTKKMGHAHGEAKIEWDIKDNAIVKLWITKKVDLNHNGTVPCLEGGDDGL